MSDPDIRINDLLRPEAGSFTSRIKNRSWPAGTFTMAVDAARHDVTSGGKIKIVVTLLCTRGELAGDFYLWDLVFDPNNPDYFLSRLHTLGVAGDFMESNPSLAEICYTIIGSQEYRVTFRDSKHNGRPTTDISFLEIA